MKTLKVLAAGSLRHAFPLIVQDYGALYGQGVDLVFGPAGLLREAIECGEGADLFASANSAHPERLVQRGCARRAIPFARNSLCVLVPNTEVFAGLDWFTALANPLFVIGMSTPESDPGGDYALMLFDNIEKKHPGIGRGIRERARSLVGGRTNPAPPGEGAASWLIRTGRADLFVGYKSNAAILDDQNLRVLDIPEDYNVHGIYTLAILDEAAETFASYLISDAAKDRLRESGFYVFERNAP